MEQVDDQVSRFTAPDGVGLRVAESGPRHSPSDPLDPTLVLVHGWSQDLRTWDRVVDDLRRAGWTGRIVRHDHRGHGGSDAAPRGTATIAQAADDLAALVADRVPDGPLVLAGHSMGGMTLLALAERHPRLVADRVVGVAFVATSSDDMAVMTLGLEGRAGRVAARGEHVLAPITATLGHRAPAGRVGSGAVTPAREGSRSGTGIVARRRAALLAPLIRALVFGRHPRRADVLSVAEQALAAHPPSVAAFRMSIAEHQRRAALDALASTPAVVLVGDHDRLCPQRHTRVIADALPGAEVVLLPGAGHMITVERSVEVAAHLHGLLLGRRLDTPAAAGPADPAGRVREVLVLGDDPSDGVAALRRAGTDDVTPVPADGGAVWDEESRTWSVRAADGPVAGRYLVLADPAGRFDEPILGRAGRVLRDARRTHLGVMVTDFPNLFLLADPTPERARFVTDAIAAVHEAGVSGVDVRAEARQRPSAARRRGRLRFRAEDVELFGRAADRPAGSGRSGSGRSASGPALTDEPLLDDRGDQRPVAPVQASGREAAPSPGVG